MRYRCLSIWFDNDWWLKNMGCNSNGYVSSGCGIPIRDGKYSSLGYTIKNPKKTNIKKLFFYIKKNYYLLKIL